jgi:hypothetical protein
MGGTIGDYDNDGDLDWYVTSIFDNPGLQFPEGKTGSRLYRNDGNRTFTEVSQSLRVRDGGWGWGTQFLITITTGTSTSSPPIAFPMVSP